jgi:hypothetical protein
MGVKKIFSVQYFGGALLRLSWEYDLNSNAPAVRL